MARKSQVFVAFVVLCSQYLHPCWSNRIRTRQSSSSTLNDRTPTSKPQEYETSKLKIESKDYAKTQETTSILENQMLKHNRSSVKPTTLAPSSQHFTKLNSVDPSAKGKLTVNLRQKLRLYMKQSLRSYTNLGKKRVRSKTAPLKSSTTRTSGSLSIRASKLAPKRGTLMIRAKSRLNRPLLKPDKGGIVMPFKMKDIRNKNWCKMVKFNQKIHHKDCEAVYVENNACHGQCMSFFVPRLFQSCSACLPSTEIVVQVTLNCPGKTPGKLTKRVKIVNSCRCKATSCRLWLEQAKWRCHSVFEWKESHNTATGRAKS